MSSHTQRWREVTLRGHRISRPPPSATNPPRIGQEVVTWRGTAWTWSGRSWVPPEAQIGLLGDIIGGPRIMRPSDDRPLTNVPPADGNLWFDGVGLQLYAWHEPPGEVGQWIVANNTTAEATIVSDQRSILGDGTSLAPIYVQTVDGSQY
jgi:hypothetical protein